LALSDGGAPNVRAPVLPHSRASLLPCFALQMRWPQGDRLYVDRLYIDRL
jgi:hypothetical protein